jgi:predicted MFS family arabinose efflux permease
MLGSRFSPEIRRALKIDISATLLFTVFAGLTNPFIGLILRRELQATPLQIAVMASAGGGCLLLSLLWAKACHGRPPLPYLVWPAFVARGVFLLVPFVSSAWSFVGLVVARDFFGAAVAPAHAAVVERIYPRAQRGRALGLVRMVGAVLGIGLALAAGQLFDRIGYRWLFVVAALVGMAASLRLRRLSVPEPETSDGEGVAGLRGAWLTVREDDAFRRLLVASFLFGFGCWIMTPAHPLLMVDYLQVSASQVGVCAAVAAVATLVGSAYWGWLVDRKSSLEALRVMYLVGAMTPLIYYIAWNPWVLVASAVTDSLLAIGLELVWMMAVIDVAGPQRTAQYVAIGATLAGVRGIAGPLVGGLVIHGFGIHAVYLIAAISTLSGAWLVGRDVRLREAVSEAPLQVSEPIPGRPSRFSVFLDPRRILREWAGR